MVAELFPLLRSEEIEYSEDLRSSIKIPRASKVVHLVPRILIVHS